MTLCMTQWHAHKWDGTHFFASHVACSTLPVWMRPQEKMRVYRSIVVTWVRVWPTVCPCAEAPLPFQCVVFHFYGPPFCTAPPHPVHWTRGHCLARKCFVWTPREFFCHICWTSQFCFSRTQFQMRHNATLVGQILQSRRTNPNRVGMTILFTLSEILIVS